MTVPFIAIVIGLLAGFIYYSSTMTSYKKAGAGQTYRFEASTDIKVTGRSDVRSGTRSRVDRGFYSSGVSASGRSEAYHMPQSIKYTVQQAQNNAARKPGAQARPQQGRPPQHRPMAGPGRPGGPRGSGRK